MITRRAVLKNLALTTGAFAVAGPILHAQPPAAAEGVFKLPQSGIGMSLPQAVRLASLNPAEAVGLGDRGEIAADKRADFVRVRVHHDAPMVRAVWREGERVV